MRFNELCLAVLLCLFGCDSSENSGEKSNADEPPGDGDNGDGDGDHGDGDGDNGDGDGDNGDGDQSNNYEAELSATPLEIEGEVGATIDLELDLTLSPTGSQAALELFGFRTAFFLSASEEVFDLSPAVPRDDETTVVEASRLTFTSTGGNPHQARVEVVCLKEGDSKIEIDAHAFLTQNPDESSIAMLEAPLVVPVDCKAPASRDRRLIDKEGQVYHRDPNSMEFSQDEAAAFGNVSIFGGTTGDAGTMVVGIASGPTSHLFAAFSLGSSDLQDVSPSTETTSGLDSVGTDGTVFVAVGNEGTLRTTNNGTAWESPTAPPVPDTGFNRKVWFGGGLFVLGSGVHSSDGGDTWVAPTTPPPSDLGQAADGAFLPGTHILVRGPGGPSSNPLSALSTDDADTWVDGTTTDVTVDAFFDVVTAKGRFVAGGTSTNGDARILTSVDGAEWSDATLPALAFGQVVVLHFSSSEDKFLAAVRVNEFIPYDTVFLESADGLTWTQVGNPIQDVVPVFLESF